MNDKEIEVFMQDVVGMINNDKNNKVLVENAITVAKIVGSFAMALTRQGLSDDMTIELAMRYVSMLMAMTNEKN